jgi:hypothetical protein
MHFNPPIVQPSAGAVRFGSLLKFQRSLKLCQTLNVVKQAAISAELTICPLFHGASLVEPRALLHDAPAASESAIGLLFSER